MNPSKNWLSEQENSSECWDISPERLGAMSPAELAEALEQALETMTEHTYDPKVISAYLDALDRKTPMPECPDAGTAYAAFQRKVQSLAAKQNEPVRLSRTLRKGLTAALIAACLFGSMAAAQAAGFDVFGAIAHWTDSVFSFGTEPIADPAHNPSGRADTPEQVIPPEFEELQEWFDQQNIPLYVPEIPRDYEAEEPMLYVDPKTSCMEYLVEYINGENYVIFGITQNKGQPKTIYEKDTNDVEIYEYNGIEHYIFRNNSVSKALWITENIEYNLSASFSVEELKNLIHTMYLLRSR